METLSKKVNNLVAISVPEKIPVFMPDAEVKQFLVFQQYFEPLSALIEAHVFEQKDATILLDFDHSGTLVKIRRNDMLWKHLPI